MKDIATQKPIDREITVPSRVPGMKDRTLVITIDSKGLSLREKGKVNIPARKMTWTQWVQFMFTHG